MQGGPTPIVLTTTSQHLPQSLPYDTFSINTCLWGKSIDTGKVRTRSEVEDVLAGWRPGLAYKGRSTAWKTPRRMQKFSTKGQRRAGLTRDTDRTKLTMKKIPLHSLRLELKLGPPSLQNTAYFYCRVYALPILFPGVNSMRKHFAQHHPPRYTTSTQSSPCKWVSYPAKSIFTITVLLSTSL